MTTPDISESPLRKESRLFSEGSTRFVNALVNKVFDLSPQASAIRSLWLVILFFLTGFLFSLINYPLGLWFQRLQDVFLFVFNSAYRATYQGDPLLSLVLFGLQVFVDPRNLHFVPLMLASFFISLQSAAIYLADIFEIEDVSIARSHVFEVALSGSDDTIRISKGEVIEAHQKSPNFLIGGPGRVIVDLDSAALFEKPDGTPHVIGPTAREPGGKATIEGFERFREAIDLRDQFIDLRDQDDRSPSVRSRSRDGIPVTATDVRLMFSVYRTPDRQAEVKPPRKASRGWFWRQVGENPAGTESEKKKEPDPYPFSENAVKNIIYKAPSQVTPDQTNPSTYKFSWINNMIGLVRGELAGFMGQRDLTAYLANTNYPEHEKALVREDEIVEQARRVFPPDEDPPVPQKVPPIPEFTPRHKIKSLFSEFAEKFTNNARDRGVELRWIGIGTWRTSIPNVFDKHLEAWKISRENQANGSEGAINGFRRQTELTRNMELIQEVPLGSYHEALALTRNTYTIIRTILVDYRKQLIQARDSWIHKGDDVPPHVQDAIRHLDDVLFHFAGRDNPPQEEVESEEDAIPGTGFESEVPGPGAIAFDELVRLVGGDAATANRLIEFERSQFPNDPPEILIERAIDRLAHDRQG
jgi:hypothetical protein